MVSAMAVVIKLYESSEGRTMKRLFCKFILILAICLMLSSITSYAAATTGEMAQFPNVTLSPDGTERAWTTDLWDKTNERLSWQYTVDMNAESSIGELEAGEHYYGKQAFGSVTIGKWVVMHTPGQCIHDTPTKDTFAGFNYRNEICHSYYNNGWFAYCADCGEIVAHMLIYARESTVKQITSMPASSIYVYQCPHCSHLEQGHSYQHYCKAISSNRYKVTYRPNAPEDSYVYGYMAPTMHMYNDSITYNGEPVSEIGYTDRALRKNSLACIGYVFAGWNTKSDGTGQDFSDGQEVINLTTEEDGIVKLYAQWRKAESSLLLDASGGTYNGKAVYEQKQKYGTSYTVDRGLIVPPAGYKVSFQSNGGSEVAAITTTKSFSHWEIQPGFVGEFQNDVYRFIAEDGHRDRLKAEYVNDSFTLPDCTGSNVSLVGWYDAPELSDKDFVGKPGDTITVDQDTVLYAKWATLTLWAYDDYDSHQGVGAVDLEWEQKDGKSKYYRLYQSEDKAVWKEIHTESDIGSDISIYKTYDSDDQGSTFTIVHTGYYTLTANGAKGADYNSSLTGGKGGSVSASYWLRQGDVLTFYAGSAGSEMKGGSNGNDADGGDSSVTTGRGGGAGTEIYLTRDGNQILLMVAGGGAGANEYASGGAGGEHQTEPGTKKGEDSAYGGGGGGGAQGGSAGEHITHTHQGSSAGGGCYGEPVRHYCSDSCYDVSEDYGWFTDEYWSGSDYIAEWCCAICGSGSGEYHFHSTTNPDGSVTVHCSGVGEPGYICCTEEHIDHVCGYQDGQVLYYNLSCQYKHLPSGAVISSKAANGGSNYINTGYGCKEQYSNAGTNDGNGSISIVSLDVGYKEQNALADVLARDKAAPDEIPDYVETLSGEDVCRITVEEPEDFGPVYYHKAESYENGTIKKLVDSNITENTLISGVAGYRYYVDGNATGTVTGAHAWTGSDRVDVAMQLSERYLHIAAVDVAGNIGPTKHIHIKAKEDSGEIEIEDDYIEDVPLKTEQLILGDTDFVYGIGNKTFYVRADGATEHMLRVGGYVDGKATNGYQVDWLKLMISSEATEEWYQTRIPKVETDAGDKMFTNMQLATNASVEDLTLWIPSSAEAQRTNHSANVLVEQRFVLETATDGKHIFLYPEASAELKDQYFYSDESEDRGHGITLIPDAKAPVISGITALENARNIDMTEESRDFVIQAADDGSGMKNLTVTIINQDNQMTRTYTSDTGELTITMAKDDYLFLGDFAVTAEAVDNVGNVCSHESANLAFTLKAELQRARFPYHGDFKAGDGAVLTITTGGYADKVIIRFPDELLALNPELDKEYIYEFPEAIKTEVYEFNIPLGTPGGSYMIEVEAWKNGRKLAEKLELPVRTAGSIIEEFRTRIRDNGV